MNKLRQTLEKALKSEASFIDSESGELNYTKVKDATDSVNEKLITLLTDNKELKEKFFTKIKDIYVFNIQDFKFFLEESKINNSYTQYANKIGLSDNSGLIENRSEVVLDFPFKDCILEGGQSTEEGTDTYFEYSDKAGKYEERNGKRNEIFFNQLLAHDEIDRLFDKKALINWKRFTKDSRKEGEAVKEIKRDKTGLIQENLIIKGNNLLTLYSLKSEFAGKIKLIYIDPPYNTGEDGFKYNDNFNHSTWLTFMKNRLEVARDLLSDDGSIFVQIDHNEQAYLKILIDQIFGRENFRNEIVWKRSQNISSISEVFKRAHDSILFYSKSKSFNLKRLYREHDDSYLNQYDKHDDVGQYRHVPLLVSGKRKGVTGTPWRGIDPNVYGKNGMHWLTIHEKLEILDKEGLIYWPKKGQPMRKYYLEDSKGRQVDDVWDDIKLITPSSKEGLNLTGQKPEELLKRILEASTNEGDIVLDFFGGTGTTGAVSHKMNRQYILTEQMDYIHDLPETRLKEVINGDQTGISKTVSWKGGGEFIYCELAKWNERAKEEIQNANDLPTLIKLFDTLYEKYFLNYNVKIKDFKEKIIKEENFKKLTLAQQKKLFLTMLDLNQMYIQESEMADKKYGISTEDQKLTKAFYSKK